MNRGEVQDFLAMVQAAYPNYNPPNRTATVNVWLMALEEYSADEVAMAFKSYLQTSTSGFAPSTGQIVDLIHKITCPPELNEEEAWSLVANAIRNGTYNSVDEFAKLPPTVQRAVGQPSQLRYWAMDEKFNEGVEKANFMNVYRVETERAAEYAKMPSEVKNLIQNTSKTSPRAQIAEKNDSVIKSSTEEKKAEILAITASQSHPNNTVGARERVEQLLNQ